jgi:hypothetical protein
MIPYLIQLLYIFHVCYRISYSSLWKFPLPTYSALVSNVVISRNQLLAWLEDSWIV